MGLAAGGDWLTPRVMGRFLLYKPPALVWLSGASLKIAGRSLVALRFPDLLAAVAAAAMVFWWAVADGAAVGDAAGYGGWISLILLLSNPLWHTFARLCYTDMLVAAALTGAMFVLRLDASLARWWSFGGFALFTALGVMAKNIAGLIPVLALIVCALWLPRKQRPSWSRVSAVSFSIVLLIAPWHVYQYIVHREWFWADYVRIQILGFGMRPPSQTSNETAMMFYGTRLAMVDPLLLVFAIAGTSKLIAYCRKRVPAAVVLGSWLGVTTAALLAFQYRNLQYAVMLLPPLALLASYAVPDLLRVGVGRSAGATRRRAWAVIALLLGLFVVKGLFPGRLWGLSFGATEAIPESRVLRTYYELGRPNELILIVPDDEFYSFVLPGLRVHYCFVDPDGRIANYASHFRTLGIIVSGDEFLHMAEWQPLFAERLRKWGLESREAVASLILVSAVSDAIEIIRQRSDIDFEIPKSLLPDPAAAMISSHDIKDAGPGRVFLLARNSPPAAHIDRARLPQRW